VTRESGRFNLALGIVGSAMGIGAAASTTIGGYMVDHLGHVVAFAGLSAVAAIGMILVATMMPETRPEADAPPVTPPLRSPGVDAARISA
jgi:predicted MFS family arabinose efflux permease